MTPEDVRRLLIGAVPPLTAPPDRMQRLRRRVARARVGRTAVVVLATTALTGGAAFGAQALSTVGPPAGTGGTHGLPAAAVPGGAAPTTRPPVAADRNGVGVGRCPQVVDLMGGSAAQSRGRADQTIATPLRSVTVCRYRHAAFDLSQPNGNADRLAGPRQGSSAAFARPIQEYLDDRVPHSPSAHPASSDPTASPPTSGCAYPSPTNDVSVDVVYAVDARGDAHEYLMMRVGCAGQAASALPGAHLSAAVDQILGPPY